MTERKHVFEGHDSKKLFRAEMANWRLADSFLSVFLLFWSIRRSAPPYRFFYFNFGVDNLKENRKNNLYDCGKKQCIEWKLIFMVGEPGDWTAHDVKEIHRSDLKKKHGFGKTAMLSESSATSETWNHLNRTNITRYVL